jgi:LysR family glycine cleavage system transcriptional activator
VALASPILFAREIEAGLLVRPFDLAVELVPGWAYWLCWPQGRRRVGKIARFRDWLLAEAQADPAVQAALAPATSGPGGQVPSPSVTGEIRG